jgi:DNA-binding transcriptional regulator LsrR (DeoR family)
LNAAGRKSRDTTLDTLNQFRAGDGTDAIGYFRKLYNEIISNGLDTEVVGEVLGLLVNSHAQLVGTEQIKRKYRDLVFQIDFDILRRIADTRRSYVIAARGYKAPAVLMVLKTGLVNSLVIDSEIAEYLIESS